MKVIARIKSIWPDRTQYKPYAYNMTFQDLFVELDVPEDTRVDDLSWASEEGEVKILSIKDAKILSLDGFTALLGGVADSIDAMHDANIKSKAAQRKTQNSNYFNN